jgi:hypothetical protein
VSPMWGTATANGGDLRIRIRSRKCFLSLWLSADVPLLAAYAFTAAASGASVRGITRLVELPTRTC